MLVWEQLAARPGVTRVPTRRGRSPRDSVRAFPRLPRKQAPTDPWDGGCFPGERPLSVQSRSASPLPTPAPSLGASGNWLPHPPSGPGRLEIAVCDVAGVLGFGPLEGRVRPTESLERQWGEPIRRI